MNLFPSGMGLVSNAGSNPSLRRLLQGAHERSGMSAKVVAGTAGISESYFSKLLNGHRCRPSRDLLLAVGLIWGIRDPGEMDHILDAAGHPGLSRPAPE